MREEEVGETLAKLIVDVSRGGLRVEEILPGKRLRNDLGLDSVALVDLIVAVEGIFDIYFDPIECNMVDIFETTTTLESFISSRRGGS